MKQILFRGKDFTGKWVFGSLIKKRFNKFADWMIEDENGLGSDVQTETIGQYIGIDDKNGVKIFEGDYLFDLEIDRETQADLSNKHPVIYNEKTVTYCVDTSFKKNWTYLVPILGYFTREQLEVRGSIHDKQEKK